MWPLIHSVTVNEIANIVISEMNINSFDVKRNYTGGNRGWKGDVPIVRMNSNKIKSLGWKLNYCSFDAVKKSVEEMLININLMEKHV